MCYDTPPSTYMYLYVPVPTLLVHAVLFVFLFFFTTPPILVASINNIKFIKDIEGKIFNSIQVMQCDMLSNHMTLIGGRSHASVSGCVMLHVP